KATRLRSHIGGEFPDQTLLELAIGYVNRGLRDDALALLGKDVTSSPGPVHAAWNAYLRDDPKLLPTNPSVAFQFPYRRETLKVLEWADEHSTNWQWSWFRALSLWAVNRLEEAATHMKALNSRPDYAPVYTARGLLLNQVHGIDPTADFRRAVALDPDTRVLHVTLVQHLQTEGKWPEALAATVAARAHFPTDFNLQLLQARALIQVRRPKEAIGVLETASVLPSENARESHGLYEQAHMLVALDALEAGNAADAQKHLIAALAWPESLGQGRPYEPEERLARFLLGKAETLLENEDAARSAYLTVVDSTLNHCQPTSKDNPTRTGLDLLTLPALRALGRGAEADSLAITAEWTRDHIEPLNDLEEQMLLRALSLHGESL
ncbi:MAG: hypothetical protein GY906_03680, partial [bacterium]|nr:hypothetical protein [bacterium]